MGDVSSLGNGTVIGVTPSADLKYACTVALLFVCRGQPLGHSRSEARGVDLDPVRSLEPGPAKARVHQIPARSFPGSVSEDTCQLLGVCD